MGTVLAISALVCSMATQAPAPGGVLNLPLFHLPESWAVGPRVRTWRTPAVNRLGAWQLGDVWPVSSWSSLDDDGSWKLHHFEAHRFFESLHLLLRRLDGSLLLEDSGFHLLPGEERRLRLG